MVRLPAGVGAETNLPYEREVLKLEAEDHTNNEIAAFLTVSAKMMSLAWYE